MGQSFDFQIHFLKRKILNETGVVLISARELMIFVNERGFNQ